MSEQKLSVLILSRNDIHRALDLIQYVYNIADEVVLLDSSDKEQRELLQTEKRKRKLTKLHYFYAVPLSNIETVKPYGISRCKHEWILNLDTDERPSEAFMRDMKSIISTTNCDAFTIKRFEEVKDGVKSSLFTWQTRLFKGSKTTYKGFILHDQAVVNGKVEKLGDDYYIEHREEIKGTSSTQYSKLLKFERMSYINYHDRLVDDAVKMFAPQSRANPAHTGIGRFVSSLMNFYIKITFRNPNSEVSNFDYWMYLTLHYSTALIKQRNVKALFSMGPGRSARINLIKEWKREPDSKEIFEISKIVNDVGTVQYLHLDNPRVIELLNEKYMDKQPKGADLLIHLLKEKYEGRYLTSNQEKKPLVCIVVLSFRDKEVVKRCVDSLYSATKYPNFKVVILENSELEDVYEFLKLRYVKKGADVIWSQRNLYFAGGMNFGIRHALKEYNPDYVLLLNNDTEFPQADWLERLVDESEKRENVGIAGPKLVWPDNKIQYAPYGNEIRDTMTKLEGVAGPAILVKSKVFERIGLLDDNFINSYDEADFYWRAKDAGIDLQYTGTSAIMHIGAHSTAGMDSNVELESKRFYWNLVNSIYFAKKHFPSPPALHIGLKAITAALFSIRNEDGAPSIFNLHLKDEPSRRLSFVLKALNEGIFERKVPRNPA